MSEQIERAYPAEAYRLSASDHATGMPTIVNNATNESVLAVVGGTPVFACLDTEEQVLETLNRPSVAVVAQNPDLDAALRTIVWWEQTCAYWRAEALKGYDLRDATPPATDRPADGREGGAR